MPATVVAGSSGCTDIAHEQSPTRVLLVQDDRNLGPMLVREFAANSIAADLVTTGRHAIARTIATGYTVIVVDATLPDRDGFEVCRSLRHNQTAAPVLMLIRRDSVSDRMRSLDSGADGYLVKPVPFEDLLARVRAMGRRGSVERHTGPEVGDLRLDAGRHQVWRGEISIDLSRREYAVLEALMRRPNQVLSRFELLAQVWGPDHEERSNVVQVYIRYLRMKIDRPFGRNSLQTVRGVGYRICNT
jgi:two-component system OmpR family response regulator